MPPKEPYTMTLSGDAGRIWTTRPAITQEGLISVVQNPQRTGIHKTVFTAVGFNKRADAVATVDNRGNVLAFRIRSNRYSLLSREGHAGTAVAMGNGEVFVAFADNVIRSYDAESGKLLTTLKGHRSRVTHLEVSPAGDALISTSADAVLLWDLRSLYRKRALAGGPYGAVMARFAGPNGDRIVVAFHDESVWVWTSDTCQLMAKLTAPPLGNRGALHGSALCESIAVSPDGRYVVAVGGSPVLFVWDLVAGALVHGVELPIPVNHASDVHFLPGGNAVVCACSDGALRVVDPFNGSVTHTVAGGGAGARSEKIADGMSVEPKGRYAAVVSATGLLRLYDLHVCRASRQTAHPKKLRVIPISAAAAEAALLAGGPGDAAQSFSLPTALSKAPSKALLDAVFPPATGRHPAWTAAAEKEEEEEDEKGNIAAAASSLGFSGRPKTPPITSGPPPSRKVRLGAGRRGPGRPARAAPATSHAAAEFPLPSGHAPLGAGVGSTATPADMTVGNAAGASSSFLHSDSGDPSLMDAVKLRNLLDAYGEFPSKYRLLVWRKMLRLPNNEEAYEALASKGIHPAVVDLPERFPIADRSLLLRLQRVASALSHWSPIFAEAAVVPGMLFPFVKAFGANEVHAFEAFATVVNNHARGWFELFPDPPFGVLAEVEAIVQFHDPELSARMGRLPGGVQGAAWQLLSTLFTDVTTADEWLKLFDHVVTNGRDLLLHLAAGFLIVWRDTIMAAPPGSPAVKQLFARDAGTNLSRLIRAAYDLRYRTPVGLVVDNPLRMNAAGGGPGGDRQSTPLAEGGIVVLPKGLTYPVFEGFPKRAVTWAAAERERLRAEEEALLARQKVVKDLSRRTDQLQQMEVAWEAEQARMAAVEEARKSELADIETQMRAEMDMWEHKERAERLRQIEVIETAYQTALERKKGEWDGELEKLRSQVEDKRAAFHSEMKRRKEDEQLRTLEFQAQQRLWALEEEQAHRAALDRVKHEVTQAAAVEEAEEKKRSMQWQTADEEVAVRRGHEAARRARLAAARREADAKASAGEMLLRRSLERDAHVATVEKERRLRAAAEAEAALSSEALEAARIREATVAAAEFQELERAAALEADIFAAASRQRKEVIDSEWSTAARDAEARVARMREAERAGRRAALESAAAERRRTLLAAAAEEEAAVKRTAGIVAAQQRRDRELEVEMQVRSVELSQRLSHSEQLASREQTALKEERAKFEALQEQLAHRAADQEGEARRRHEELMSRLILEREKQLLELDTAWRKKAARAEMAGLQNEAAAYRKAMAEREAAYTAREREYLAKIEELRRETAAEAARGDNPLMPPPPPMTTTTTAAAAGGARRGGGAAAAGATNTSAGALHSTTRPPTRPSGHSTAVSESMAEVASLVDRMPTTMPRDSRSSAGYGAAFSDSTGLGDGSAHSPLSDSPLSGNSPEGSHSRSPDGGEGSSSRMSSEAGTPSRTFNTTSRTAITVSTPGGATFSTEDSGTGGAGSDANDLTLSPGRGM